MERTYEFNVGDTYWYTCKNCKKPGIHKYRGLQMEIKLRDKVIPPEHFGTCTNCDSTRKIELTPTQLEKRL